MKAVSNYHPPYEWNLKPEEKEKRTLVGSYDFTEYGKLVHHIDHDKKNNHPDNLMVMTQSEHARLHMTKNLLCGVEGCGKKHRQRGYCDKHRKMYKTGRIEPCQS